MQKITWETMRSMPCMVCHAAPMEYRVTIPYDNGIITLSICAKCARLTPTELSILLKEV